MVAAKYKSGSGFKMILGVVAVRLGHMGSPMLRYTFVLLALAQLMNIIFVTYYSAVYPMVAVGCTAFSFVSLPGTSRRRCGLISKASFPKFPFTMLYRTYAVK